MGSNAPSSSNASELIGLGLAETDKLVDTVLDSPLTSEGHVL